MLRKILSVLQSFYQIFQDVHCPEFILLPNITLSWLHKKGFKKQKNSQVLFDNIKQESGFNDLCFKKKEGQLHTSLFVGQQICLLLYLAYFPNN